MSERLLSLYDRTILQHPKTVLILLALVIAMLATYIPGFKLDASSDSLVLEGDESLRIFREVGKRYSSEDFLIITVEPRGDLYADDVLREISALRERLLKFDRVSSVTSMLDVPLLQSPKIKLSELSESLNTLRDDVDRELVREEFKSSPVYRDLLVSRDASTTAIQVNLKRDTHYVELLERREQLQLLIRDGEASAEQRAEFDTVFQEFRDYQAEFNQQQSLFIDDVRSLLDEFRAHGVAKQIHLGGVPMIAADMISFVKSDLLVFGTGIVIFMVCILSIIFRRLRWVSLPVLVCISTVTLMMGFLAFLDWRMTVVSSNFVALLLIVTLSINVHLIVRYRELHGAGEFKSQHQLVRETVHFMFTPCLYTAMTTVVAFVSLVVSGIRPVIDFGWMMTIGIGVALMMSFLILPCILILLPRQDPVPSGTTGAFTIRFATATERFGSLILVVAAVLAILAGVGISRLEVENRFIDFFDESTEIYQGMELVDAQLGGTIPMEILLKSADLDIDEADGSDEFSDDFADEDEFADSDFSDDFSSDEAAGFADDFADDFGDDFSDNASDTSSAPSVWFNRAGMSRVEQLHDWLEAQPETGKVMSLATLYKLMQILVGKDIDDIQLVLAQQSLPDSIQDIMIRPHLIDELNETRITVRVKETSKELRRNEYLQRVANYLENDLGFSKDEYEITGMLVLYNNMLQSLYRSQILTIAAVFVAIMLMFIVLFRSFSLAVIGIIPNILAASIVLGGMGLVGIPLDMMTITIAAISIGIGVDNTIHYIHRFKREYSLDQNYLATMYRCHGSIGKAMYYTSCTIIFGFAILALSNFKPSIYFGLLTGVAMLAALLGALLLLPQLLVRLKPLGRE
ncbi:MAG: RND family transporter [Pseudomonadales bacterium]